MPELVLHFLVDNVRNASVVSGAQTGLEVTHKLNLGNQLVVEVSFVLVDAVQLNQFVIQLLNQLSVVIIQGRYIQVPVVSNTHFHRPFGSGVINVYLVSRPRFRFLIRLLKLAFIWGILMARDQVQIIRIVLVPMWHALRYFN